MTNKPKKDSEESQNMAKTEEKQPKIMTKPLPEILDELEDYTRRVEEAVKLAHGAAKESREAAAQAKLSGEKAAEAARKAAEEAVSKVRDEASRANEAVNERVTDLETELNELKENAKQEAFAMDQALLEAQRKHIEESPFLKG